MQKPLAGIVAVFTLWTIVAIWRAVGPYVGFVGLAIWVAWCFWLADRWDREADQRFLELLRSKGWAAAGMGAIARRAKTPRS